MCLTFDFDETIHTINKSASVTEFFSKTFDPILEVVSKDSNFPFTLKRMSQEYKAKLQSQSLMKYRNIGYAIFDFSSVVRPRQQLLYFDFETAFPEFCKAGYDACINKYPKPNISLIIRLYQNEQRKKVENYNYSYAILINGGTMYVKEKRFYSLTELSNLIIRDMKISWYKNIKVSLDDQKMNNMVIYLLLIFCFIYNKTLSNTELEWVLEARNNALIILPFIGIKISENEKVEFVYF